MTRKKWVPPAGKITIVAGRSGASHETTRKPGVFVVGSLMKRDEYAISSFRRPPAEEDATTLRQARYVLRDLHAKHPECGYGKMADACERAADCAQGIPHAKSESVPPRDNKGWHSCPGCIGQWVHDTLAPCSVCYPNGKPKPKPKRKPRVKLPLKHYEAQRKMPPP